MIISNRHAVEEEIGPRCIPCVVLLTAWTIDAVSASFWKNLITFLLDNGTTYFVCVGGFAEQLHDEIDDIMYRYDEEHESVRSNTIVTTYHTDETLEDAISYYVYGTELRDKEYGCLFAILDSTKVEDGKVQTLLENA